MARPKDKPEKDMRSLRSPVGFVPVGDTFMYGGRCVVVKDRPSGLEPRQACVGCAFSGGGCPAIACSSFDRIDGRSVWFESVQYEDYEER